MGALGSKPAAKTVVGKKARGGKKTVSERDKAILQIKNVKDELSRTEKRLISEVENLKMQALELVKNGNKERALLLLQLKKNKTTRIDNIIKQIYTLEENLNKIDEAKTNNTIMKALETASNELKYYNESTPLDKVLELLDDVDEQTRIQKEISIALGNGAISDYNDEDLLRELDNTLVNKQTNEIKDRILPSVPVHSIGKIEENRIVDEEDETRILSTV
jgi:hypothetical protein